MGVTYSDQTSIFCSDSFVDRAYTPVMGGQLNDKPKYTFDKLDFLIKIYDDGKLTPAFRNMTAGKLKKNSCESQHC